MIIMLFINVLILALGAIFSWLPIITTIPTILGFDIDSALVQAVGYFKTFVLSFWVYQYVFYGMLVLVGYYSLRGVIRFFLGSRAP